MEGHELYKRWRAQHVAQDLAFHVGSGVLTAYYNEIDPYAAEWLRNLIAAGHIAPGDVDTRSIVDVREDDLRSYSQCHFFAGIGGWSRALRLAGWADDRPVWTGSCPCQPFSAAGKRKGVEDDRHLWPELQRLVAKRNPPIVFGEQVASKDGRGWLAGVRADLEALGYAVGAADLCAAGVGAPHIRQRLWWVADADGWGESDPRIQRGGEQRQQPAHGEVSIWSYSDTLGCADARDRRLSAPVLAMANGLPGRLGRLRAYGNAIVPQVAAEFILAATS